MASIRKQGKRYEIRECLSTDRGPRQRTLVSFQGVLSPEVLDLAEAKASKPLKRDELVARAAAMDIPVGLRRRFPEARALLAQLQRGARLDPGLVGLLKTALEPLPSEPLPSHLEEAAEWIGQSEREHGRALRGLLRAADRVLQSRGFLRTRPRAIFPRFSSERGGAS
jgi:hypothetical protein